MATSEAIRFPFRAQLERGATFPAHALRDSSFSPPGSPPRFADKTELCWRIACRVAIEEGDLGDWKSGDSEQPRVFVRNERDGTA
jgi:hypothetical protein